MEIWKDPFSAECRSFLERIRKREIAQPTVVGFSADAWGALKKGAKEADTERLLGFGISIFRSLERIRIELAAAQGKLGDDVHRGHLVLLAANTLCLHVEDENRTPTREGDFLVPDFVASEQIDVLGQQKSTMVSFVESVYDSVRFPLPFFCAEDVKKACLLNPSDQHMAWGRDVFLLSTQYSLYEYLWGRVLWGESLIELDDGIWRLTPSQESIEKNIAISKHISEVDKIQTPLEILSEWNKIPEEDRLRFIPPKAVVSIRKDRMYVHWRWDARDTRRPPMELAAMQILRNRLPLPVLDLTEPCPGTTIQEAMKVRGLLSMVGEGIVDAMSGAHPETVRRIICGSLDRDALIESVSSAAHIPPKKAEMLIELFTLRDQRSEVWYQPLTDHGSGRLGYALHPLRFATAVRTVEWLFSRDRRREGLKGRAFEDGVVDFLREAASRNAVVDVGIYPRLKTSNEVGDVDIVCVFFDTLLVVECKCPSQPASDHDFYNRKETLVLASMQAERKASYISRNLDRFIRRHKISSSGIKSIIPVVLASGNEFVGCSVYGNIPVVSKGSLSLAIANLSGHVSALGGDGSVADIRPALPAVSTANDCGRKLLETIDRPGLFDPYMQHVVLRRSDFSLRGDATDVTLSYLEVAFDEAGKSLFAESMGFGIKIG